MKTKKPLPPVYLFVGLTTMIAFHFLVPAASVFGSPWRYTGVVPLAAGILINLWADRLFKKYNTAVKPFRDSTVLVVKGPYRFSRNPMYLGGLLILIGTWILLGSATPVLVVAILFFVFRAHFIIPEERDMERQFGEQYLAYTQRVKRWL